MVTAGVLHIAAELSSQRALPSWNVVDLLESYQRGERPARSAEKR